MKRVSVTSERELAAALQRARSHPEYEAEGLKLKVADALLKMMDEQGVNRSELARRAGTSPAYISKVFRGYENLSLKTMVKLAWALEAYWEPVISPIGQTVRTFLMSEPPPEIPKKDIEDQSDYTAHFIRVLEVDNLCEFVA